MKILAQLNSAQLEAVTHREGPALVIAGAGSGKTRVLTRRLAYLIEEEGVSPFSILAITFTNKAAREMKKRCRELVGEVVRDMWVSTFHSACLRILRSHAHRAGYSRDFVVYDRSEQLTAIKQAMENLQIDTEQFEPKTVLNRIGRAKNELDSPADLQNRGNFYLQRVAEIYKEYQRQLRQYNAMDFDDLLAVATNVLLENEEVLGKYQDKFKHVMVDEYQDTNHAQYRLLRLLAVPQRNVFAVGDSDQSIYSWRGADLSNILDFESDYPEASVYKLEENYRSTEPILDAAQRVIQRNQLRQRKNLWTRREGGHPVCYYQADSGEQEARFVISYIRQLCREEDFSWSDFAVMYRTNAQSRLFEEACNAMGVPYQILGATRFYDREEIRDAISFLRLLINQDDWVSLQRVINKPRRSVGAVTQQRLVDYAGEHDLSIYETLSNVEQIPGIRRPQQKGVKKFAEALEKTRQQLQTMQPAEALQMILDECRYHDHLAKKGRREKESRTENLEELISSAHNFIGRLRSGQAAVGDDISSQGKEALTAFVGEVALLSDVDQMQEDQPRATLLTLHSAKGLEFPVVFIVGMEEGLLPHSRAVEDPEELEEERRLCYVGMTRAQDRLFLTLAKSRSLYGEFSSARKPSRFLEEIGTDSLVSIAEQKLADSGQKQRCQQRKNTSASFPKHGRHSQAHVGNKEKDLDGFRSGAKIHHKMWGTGTIVSRKTVGGDVELKLTFPDQGIKTVVAEHAPIKLVEK